jgi:hypothetical protein
VSEWFLLESLMQQFRVPGLGYRLVLALAGAAVALTAGFAGVTFVRLTGFVVLGARPAGPGRAAQGDGAPPRGAGPPLQGDGPLARGDGLVQASQDEMEKAPDYGWLGRAGLVILGAGCLLTSALLPLVVRVIAAGLAPVVPAAVTSAALKSPWVVQPVFGGFSILSPSWLWIAMPSLLITVTAFTRVVSGTRMTRVRRVPAWRSATAGVDGADSYTASGFANPTRRVLASVLHTRAEIRTLDPGPAETASTPGGPSAAVTPGAGAHLGYSSDVIEVVETYLYRPLVQPLMMVVRAAKRLQSGRLDAYLAYMLIALIAVIAIVVAMA